MDSVHRNGSATYTEIKRQQRIWKGILEALESERQRYKEFVEHHRDALWVFTGCGSSYYLAQTGSHCFSEYTSLPCKAVPASEILMFPEVIFPHAQKSILVGISRSGSTTETLRALEKAKHGLNIPSLAISCDPDSEMSLRSDHALKFPFEKENAVVMTSSFTSMLLAILYLAWAYKQDPELWHKLMSLPDESEKIMNRYEDLMAGIGNLDDIESWVFLGQGPFYGIANEGALKIGEMTLSLSQSYHSLEYRHGPMSTAGERTLIVVLCSQAGRELEQDLVRDLKKLGAKILLMGDVATTAKLNEVDYKVTVPADYGDLLTAFLYLPLLQLLGYFRARRKGLNPDSPKNLTAVVKLDL